MEIHGKRARTNLPPGYRFCPLEEELVLYYLCPKVKGEEVPGEDYLVFNSNLYGVKEPWKIWDEFEGRRENLKLIKDLYFFTERNNKTENNASGRKDRTIGRGTWKGVDTGMKVYSGCTVVGYKKRFSYDNKESVQHGRWIMLEFELDRSLVGMLDEQEAQKYVLCILRKNDKRKRVGDGDLEKLATRGDVPDDFPAQDEYMNVKQEESVIKQGEEDQGMHATGDINVFDAGPSSSSKLQGEENSGVQYLNPKLFNDDDILLPLYADALQWEEETYLATQSSVPSFENNMQPLADHELRRKAENYSKQCPEHGPLMRPFTADCETMRDMLGEESYLSKQCPGKCIHCDYAQPFASPDQRLGDILKSSKEHFVPRVAEQEQHDKSSKAKRSSIRVSTSTNYQPDMIGSKSTTSIDHHRANDDPRRSNDAGDGLGAGTNGCRYTPWILSFAEELLRGV